MSDLKTSLRESPLKPLYLWLANRWRGIRRLFAYPDTASVGVVDYDIYAANGLDVRLADINKPASVYMREHFADRVFDYVILSEIIEHLPDPESLLRDLQQFVRKGFIVSIPNTGFHQHRLRLLLGRFPLQWVVMPGEHLCFWTRADFHWWARQLGYQIAREVPYEGTPLLKDALPGLFAAAFVYLLTLERAR
jgi:SAM-dependent methyltransferase